MIDPQYPALLVHEDRSISVMPDSGYWTMDPDAWFQSDASDFLVDNNGIRFDQEQRVERDRDGRPKRPPGWIRNRQLEDQEILKLCSDALEVEHRDMKALMSPIGNMQQEGSTRRILDYLVEIFKP